MTGNIRDNDIKRAQVMTSHLSSSAPRPPLPLVLSVSPSVTDRLATDTHSPTVFLTHRWTHNITTFPNILS